MAFWAELDAARRVQLAIALALAFVVLIAVGSWSAQPAWTDLLKGRDYDELLDAAAALDGAEVQYRIHNGSLQVGAPQIGAAQAALASEVKLPGLADVTDLQLGLTPKAQAWAFLRAREGDLASVINGIDGVAASRVHLVPAREALFLDEQDPARASVFIRLRPGRAVDSSQVRAITNLVAGAVDGLTSDRVTVIDDKGALLAEGSGPGNEGGPTDEAAQLLSRQAEIEARYERRVSQSLLPVLGFEGGFSVTAHVDLDPTSDETVTRRLDPKSQSVGREAIEESDMQREEAGGVPGVSAELPERPDDAARGVTSETTSRTESEFIYTEENVVSRRPAGRIERLSVAVQVDSAKVDALADASGVSPTDLQDEIRQTVETAVGMDPSRNDQVAVHFMPFSQVEMVEEGPGSLTAPQALTSAMPYALAALATILVFVFVVRPLMTSVTTAKPVSREMLLAAQGAVPEIEENLAQRLRRLTENFTPVDADELSALVSQQPQAAAKVLKQWQRTE